MKKNIVRSCAVIFLLVFLGIVPLQAQSAGLSPSGEMTVQVSVTQIRAAPSAIAPVLATVEYRAKVFVHESREGWAKVSVPGMTRYGYMFLSALTSKAVAPASPGDAVPGVTGTEIALAGKGFNESLEETYSQSAHVDFSWVNTMESWAYEAEALVGFLAGAR